MDRHRRERPSIALASASAGAFLSPVVAMAVLARQVSVDEAVMTKTVIELLREEVLAWREYDAGETGSYYLDYDDRDDTRLKEARAATDAAQALSAEPTRECVSWCNEDCHLNGCQKARAAW
ncbi:MAG TPA: hypothetical protein VFS24_11715, partial [Steroidobacteraceae bacterium]|nr:hypothetical protein [Steroidobacteraceae bacterium]